MDYLMTFLEGLLSFVSPCVLHMVPIYITYLIGESHKIEDDKRNKDRKEDKKNSKKLYLNSLFFILGFIIVFMIFGLFSSIVGSFLSKYQLYINIVFGIILIIFGFNLLGILKISFLHKERKFKGNIKTFNMLTSFVFGLLFALSWTPCVGPFLASAMMRAATSGKALSGVLMLLSYALGIGIPFFLSAVFLAKIKIAFNFIKKHQKIINIVSGVLIIIFGILKIFNIHIGG